MVAEKFKANPKPVDGFSQKGESNVRQEKTKHAEFLPEVNKTESVSRFFESTVDELLSSGTAENINSYWANSYHRNKNLKYNLENSVFRNIYQYSPGVVYKEGDDTKTISYFNFLKKLEEFGSDIKNHDKLFSEPGYTLDIPINIDAFINYSNYYWLEGNIPLIEIEDSVDIDDITNGRLYYTTNDPEIDLVTGLRVKFNNGTKESDDISDNIYYVENVGNRGGIKLVEIEKSGEDRFPYITPYTLGNNSGWDDDVFDNSDWDEENVFEPYSSDTRNERTDLDNNRDYVVMERWSYDKNPWSRTNRWFSIHAIEIAAEFGKEFLEVDENGDNVYITFKEEDLANEKTGRKDLSLNLMPIWNYLIMVIHFHN